MAFSVQNINVDVIHGQATLIAVDQTPPNPGKQPKSVTVFFPFDPPLQQGKDRDAVVAAAKAVLQQALNDIS